MIDDGGPAFPSLNVFTNRDGEVDSTQIDCMTLRDYFAATAIPQAFEMELSELRGANDDVPAHYVHPNQIAKRAYEIANAMLRARKEK